MEEELLIVCVAVLNKKNKIVEGRRLFKKLRDENDPFAMPENVFRQNFRFPKSLCWDLVKQLEPFDNQKSSLPFTIRFLACVYVYSHNSYQKYVKNISISQSSISRAVHHITKLIVHVKRNEIHFPQTLEELTVTKKGFYTTFGMNDIIGAVDCTHIGIRLPSVNDPQCPPRLYMNKKGFSSINVEAICDHRLLFTSVNAKFGGSCHDSVIWRTSPIRAHLMKKHNIQSDTLLLGDQGYPLEPWLLTPLAGPTNPKDFEYNKLHAKTHNTIRLAFGILKSRFKCLSKYCLLHYDHEKAANIIYACMILHNILLKHGVSVDINKDEEEKENENSDDGVKTESEYLSEGQTKQLEYIMSL